MNRIVVTSKITLAILLVGYLVVFWADLLNNPDHVSLLDKLILTTPVLLAIRISIIFIAFGSVILIATTLWKGVSIGKIGGEGVELINLNAFSNKTKEELKIEKAKIEKYKARIKTLEGEKRELEDLVSAMLFSQQEVKQ